MRPAGREVAVSGETEVVGTADWNCRPLAPQADGLNLMGFVDRGLNCIDFGADLVFTAGEQLLLHDIASLG